MVRGYGRDGTKAAYWRRMIEAQAGTGLSIRAWCRKHHLRESAYYWWRKQLARRDARTASLSEPHAKTRSASFLPVRVTDSQGAALDEPTDTTGGGGRIEILFPDHRRIRIHGPVDRQTLADVVAVLKEAAGSAECRPC